MSFRTDFLKEHGWQQVSARKWKAPWCTTDVETLKAEKMQKQILGGAVMCRCHCGWPLAQILRQTGSGQVYVECYECHLKRVVGLSDLSLV